MNHHFTLLSLAFIICKMDISSTSQAMACTPVKCLEPRLAREGAPLGCIQDHTLWQVPAAAHTLAMFLLLMITQTTGHKTLIL